MLELLIWGEIKIWQYQPDLVVPITWARCRNKRVAVGLHCLFAGTVPQSGCIVVSI